MVKKFKNKKFYSSTTIEERGQVVITKEVRDDFGLKKGEKLLFFGFEDIMAFIKFNLLKPKRYLEKDFKSLKKIIEKEKWKD